MPPAITITPIQAFSLGADAVYLSKRDPPTAPDGHYDWEVSEDTNASQSGHSAVTNLINRVETITSKGAVKPDPKVVEGFIDMAVHPGAENDRDGVFEAGLTLMSRLPAGSTIGTELSNTAVGMLYNTIPHPPADYVGPEYAFRQADGSYNNIHEPNLGKAGMKYARSVQPKRCIPASSLPDPGLVFDTLLRARDRVDHTGGNSSLTFAFASIVTHSLFRSNPRDWTINDTSSYLDLSPLYGYNQATQDSVRNKTLGRGLLYPDTFAEERLLFLPPAASALLVVLSRNHNYVADMLLKVNEKKLWSDPPPEDPALRTKQDEEIFQTARLVNGGHFISLIMGDYVAGFLGMAVGNAWNMNAFDPIKLKDGEIVHRGEGNHVSVEFNLLYRWHTTTSAADQTWTEEVFSRAFGGKPFDEITIQDFGASFMKILSQLDPDPSKRTFGNLQRGADGKFSDDDLANILHDATESPAGQYRARGTPEVLRIVEVMGIMQGRQWGVCTMNEFRNFLGLKQFKTFEEWNPDPEIAEGARRLYGHVDNLELYTGLQCESTMPLSGGLRFACGYTMTKAVLGDAIALVRGDRFYTTSYTPSTMTAWGFQDCKRDPNNGGFGGNLPKLLARTLSRHYPFNSSYTTFPFFTPATMKASLTHQGIADRYTFTRPVASPIPKILNTFTGIKTVFNDPSRFKAPYDMSGLGEGYGFILVFDEKAKHDADKALALHALFPTKDSLTEYSEWYREQTKQKIQERSWKYDGVPGTYVDIVKDVINIVSVHWAADRLCGIPLKTKENPRALYTEQEIYEMFTTLFTLTFLAIDDNEHGFSLRWTAVQAGGVIQALVAKSVVEVAPSSATNGFITLYNKASNLIWPPTKKPYYEFLSKLSETGRPVNQLVATVVGLAIGSSVNYCQAAVHVVDFYFDDKREKQRAHIIELVQKKDGSGDELLRGYVREAMRLNPQFTGLWRNAAVDAEIQQGSGLPSIKIKAGDRIWASFRNAHLNPTDFPNPTNVDPTRPKASYNLNGTGFHGCPGVSYAEHTIAEILKVIFGLKNVRRAQGDAGKLVGFTTVINETETNVYVQPNGTTSPWPGSMHLVYDEA
ncbi:heme peroxidase [Ramaria rubella]|nr:heme peroxidase [Ramaria rubella]